MYALTTSWPELGGTDFEMMYLADIVVVELLFGVDNGMNNWEVIHLVYPNSGQHSESRAVAQWHVLKI